MTDYAFLEDELAVHEIRKHKWIESQKKGEEVGFATAAIDWIEKYGYAWQQFRLSLQTPQNSLNEKRHYRRFHYRFPLQLKIQDTQIVCHSDNISLIGLTCTIPKYFPDNTSTQVVIHFNLDSLQFPSTSFQFNSRIARIKKQTPDAQKAFKVFLPFTEEVRDYLRLNAKSINYSDIGLSFLH